MMMIEDHRAGFDLRGFAKKARMRLGISNSITVFFGGLTHIGFVNNTVHTVFSLGFIISRKHVYLSYFAKILYNLKIFIEIGSVKK